MTFRPGTISLINGLAQALVAEIDAYVDRIYDEDLDPRIPTPLLTVGDEINELTEKISSLAGVPSPDDHQTVRLLGAMYEAAELYDRTARRYPLPPLPPP